MTKLSTVRATAEQTMQRADLRRYAFAHGGIQWQVGDGAADGGFQAGSGLTRWRSKTNAQWRALFHGNRLQQTKQPYDGGGFAGAGAAGDQCQGATAGHGAGNFLPVWRGFFCCRK